MAFKTILAERGRMAGFHFSEEQLARFFLYYQLVIEKNKVMNLTNIVEEEEFVIKHIIDSLLSFDNELFPGKSIADIGSGAGFPGIPLKIFCENSKFYLVDSLAKRLRFLEDVIDELDLKDVYCVHARAEDFAHNINYREKFDVVTARAVAKMNVLAEYCLPLVKLKGTFIALKGSKAREEVEAAEYAFKILGGQLSSVADVKLPGLDDGRTIIKVKKIKLSPATYPRKAGIPEKNPLERGKEK